MEKTFTEDFVRQFNLQELGDTHYALGLPTGIVDLKVTIKRDSIDNLVRLLSNHQQFADEHQVHIKDLNSIPEAHGLVFGSFDGYEFTISDWIVRADKWDTSPETIEKYVFPQNWGTDGYYIPSTGKYLQTNLDVW